MKRAYDFHIHTAASPCGDDSMTPNNIVNMAIIKELDAIAITDHNSCVNIKAVMEVAKNTPLLIIPGMEVETSEAFHVITLFESLDQVIELGEIVSSKLPKLNNRKDIFGNQIIYDALDQVIGEVDRLLLTSTQLSIYELTEIVEAIGGVSYPAHIDRPSYSIISSLGVIPPDLNIRNIELSRHVDLNPYKITYPSLRLIQSSDAHYLEDILERQSYMEIKTNSSKDWIMKLREKQK